MLTHNNYGVWHGPMASFIAINKCAKGIKPQPPAPAEVTDESRAAALVAQETNEIALAYLRMYISEQMWEAVEGMTSAREVWVALEELHRQKSLAAFTRVERDLITIRQAPGEDVDAYFTRARGLRRLASAAGKPVDEERVVVYLLDGLRPEFESMIAHLQGGEIPTLAKLLERARAVETSYVGRRTREASEEAAFAARAGGGGRGRGGRGRGRGRGAAGPPGCWNCGRLGHLVYYYYY